MHHVREPLCHKGDERRRVIIKDSLSGAVSRKAYVVVLSESRNG
jgi:hypothetical protein